MTRSPAGMIEAVTRSLQKNSGKSAAESTALLRRHGPRGDDKAQYTWLRAQGLGHVAAKIFSGALKPYAEPDKLVAAQYARDKAPARAPNTAG